jgi:uncharacterized protein
VKDPQFDTDVGFFVFQLPFLDFVVGWLFAAFIIILFVTAGAHYLNGGIRVQTPLQRVTPQVKAHLSVLLGVLALIKAADYWLQRYELAFSTRGVVDGAGYTDVNAQLPALNLLILIALFAFVLFIVNIRRRGWVLPVIAVGLWGVVFVVAAGIVPAFVQRFQVEPAESEKEREYIGRNIEATRAALDLADVEVEEFAYNENLSAQELQDNAPTIRNVRLLDPNVVDDTYQRLQGLLTFYRFPDLDIDRYEIDGQITQVVLSARELDRSQVPQQSWEGTHLAYTHGYGLAMAPANAVTQTGRPDFIVRDLPPETPEEIELEQPAIYHGESIGGYSIVRTGRNEVDYVDPETGENVPATYEGTGGVTMSSYLRRVAFALRFGDINPVISNFIRDDSRILYVRDVRERVEMLAPFLHFDSDPYPVVHDGRIVYFIDAYTTTNHYPYAQRAETGQLRPGSGLNHGFNYVRNSVKAVVDAYDGTVTLYVVDGNDPIIQAYRKAFPDLFTDYEEMPEGLRAHMRYPEDLFRTQTTMYARYHIENPGSFYEQTDAWSVAQDPGTQVTGEQASQTADPVTGELGPARERRIDPYYLLMRLPEEEQESFVLLRPFVPFSENDNRNELTSFMVAKSDPDEYGRLIAYEMPRGALPDGPAIVASNINSEEEIAQRISLLNREGSSVRFGNLLLIPVNDSILYIRPLYVQAAGRTAVPELKNVIAVFGPRVVMRNTLQQALEDIFGEAPETFEEAPDPDEEDPDGGEPGGESPDEGVTDEERVARIFGDLEAARSERDEALANGDLGAYQDAVADIDRLLEQLERLIAPATTTTTTAPAAEA